MSYKNKSQGMGKLDWEWADEALRDNRCSAEFAREAATRCEALRRQRDELSRAGYFFFASRQEGGPLRVNSTISSPSVVLMS